MIAHKPARALAHADQAAHAAFLVQAHHAVGHLLKRHDGTHIHAGAALVADFYNIAALFVRADAYGALFFILRLVPGPGAYVFAEPAARAPGGIGCQLFQSNTPLLPKDMLDCRRINLYNYNKPYYST